MVPYGHKKAKDRNYHLFYKDEWIKRHYRAKERQQSKTEIAFEIGDIKQGRD